MSDRVAPVEPDGLRGTIAVLDRPLSSLVLYILAGLLAAVMVVVAALDLDRSLWLILVEAHRVCRH